MSYYPQNNGYQQQGYGGGYGNQQMYPPQQNYPPPQQNYPPPQQMYPPQQGYPPAPPAPQHYPQQSNRQVQYQQQPPPQQQQKQQDNGIISNITTGLSSLVPKGIKQTFGFGDNQTQRSPLLNNMNPMSLISYLPGIYLKQQLDFLESLTGCEQNSVFEVFPGDGCGMIASEIPIFQCRQDSQCLQRTCLAPDCRPFNMDISFMTGNMNQEGQPVQDNFVQITREYQCTYLWWNRPEMMVYTSYGDAQAFIGRILFPFLCCTLGLEIFDQNGIKKYIIQGSVCQLGFCCRQWPCQACQQCFFDILDANNREKLSVLIKKSSGCIKACAGNVDDFQIQFPVTANADDKVLIMAAAIFLDYNYFQNPPDRDQEKLQQLKSENQHLLKDTYGMAKTTFQQVKHEVFH